jgi:hypothetical protein
MLTQDLVLFASSDTNAIFLFPCVVDGANHEAENVNVGTYGAAQWCLHNTPHPGATKSKKLVLLQHAGMR